ncbi:similar to Saccharomyces cerevisiae YLR195C NMT1 N-myristoyl transferase [Maudiozyma saulgeensis]|uniref:Glycylpeptide N-tetradecanoyltransferase n=1 Tax=Maudiozyma saulgeensis TaxID=1789683 RepID=A0A1X7R2H1_9SACH|nr:similar to Saccharomyces cerevisiae YLR195C NMT1 N-myristoyl transferase [Kazachstania saulgeensis]
MDQKKLEDLLKLLQVNQGDLSKLTEQQRKDMKDYKFWKTQPVQKFDEAIDQEGPIDATKTPADVRDEPYPMLAEFEWSTVDINDAQQMEDVFILLNENYVEDKDASFRFNYTKEFFHWALKPPGWREEWNVGVRVKSTGKLIAFISAIPINLAVRGKDVPSVEINFLCVHKQLRSKRMTPVLIKEITRRVNKQNIWQALYTAGVVLPSPVTTCRYAHRPINWNKLQEVGFTDVPAGKTAAEMVALYTLPKDTKTKGLRPMELKDIGQMMTLFEKYESRFELVQAFNESEFTHWFLGGNGKEEIPDDKKVIFTYVVENEEGKITDFFSFYSLPFTVLEHDVHSELGIGYLFYYASDADLKFSDRFSEDATKALKTRLNSLISDATILAKRAKMDVFNALTSQDNTLFLDDLKFGPGDGFLNFYLFNYKAFPIGGGLKDDKSYDIEKRSNVGVVML